MSLSRPVAALALAAGAMLLIAPAAQAATATAEASSPWGPRYAPGQKAKAVGTLTATGEDHADLPTADSVKITGKVYDYAASSKVCGWAVFRITYRDGNQLPFKHRSVRDCTYRTAKKFAFTDHDVYQVELKVCAEGKRSRPSDVCLYAGTWKTLYLSK
ncbi:hypothetical protein OUY22_09655 [Nonomuraea sp. MCN248]|uniref:Secreted protein n=1 Tax=Nonomuraea corallina TaxID=2989783 RepID=A0ABT4S8Y9_9ACTN|nr:hypothetical protein [Nonomuraea corallina]MDA0633682.1 hypothetical protein [Nonomuraea corallina]